MKVSKTGKSPYTYESCCGLQAGPQHSILIMIVTLNLFQVQKLSISRAEQFTEHVGNTVDQWWGGLALVKITDCVQTGAMILQCCQIVRGADAGDL